MTYFGRVFGVLIWSGFVFKVYSVFESFVYEVSAHHVFATCKRPMNCMSLWNSTVGVHYCQFVYELCACGGKPRYFS